MIKRILALLFLAILALLTVAMLIFIISISAQRTNDRESLAIGETYPVDGPYPATLRISGFSNNPYAGVVQGDLTVILPEGSKDPRITRFKLEGQKNCQFSIDFTAPDGTRQTETWNYCSTLKSFSVVPDEIFVR